MIKYSLQNECLENIEAFTDEQMSREMAVIESVLEIYNKTILMMELSNSDVDIPDCSMFMESTFFQEEETPPTEGNATTTTPKEGDSPAPAQPATGGEPAKQPAQDNAQGDGKDKSGETKKPMTEEERKKYNAEHHFRKVNKEGKIENMFISIITFIPRLFMLPIKLLINLIKKKKNNKATENAKNATPEEKAKVAQALKKDEGKNTGNTKIEDGAITASATVGKGSEGEEQVQMSVDGEGAVWTNIDLNSIGNAVDQIASVFVEKYGNPQQTLTAVQPLSFNIGEVKANLEAKNKAYAEQRQRETLEAFEGKRAQIVQALENRAKALEQCVTNIQNCIKEFEKPNALKGYDLQPVVNARKTDLNNIKTIISFINTKIQELTAIDALTSEIFGVYEKYLSGAKDIVNAANKTVDSDMAALERDRIDVSRGQTPSQEFKLNPTFSIDSQSGGENNE